MAETLGDGGRIAHINNDSITLVSAGSAMREPEALAEINRARQFDPLSPNISAAVELIHTLARHYDEAIAVCKKAANENPTFSLPHLCLAQAY